MSLADRRWVPLFPESWEAATSATFATSSKTPTVSAEFSVATHLRRAATFVAALARRCDASADRISIVTTGGGGTVTATLDDLPAIGTAPSAGALANSSHRDGPSTQQLLPLGARSLTSNGLASDKG